MARILYLAHDLDDAAIWRRVAMMRLGGATVEVAGFRRGDGPLPDAARVLGRTRNARMSRRALSVLQARLGAKVVGDGCFDAIVARNLEMLALAVPAARRARRSDGSGPRLVYEVLDIHRLMQRDGVIGRVLRALERRLCRSVDLVLVSSPAFVSHHFDKHRQTAAPVLLVENKVMAPSVDDRPEGAAPGGRHPEGGPIVIGWFGILRCAFSLACLDALTRAAPGRYRVLLCGRPAEDALPGFAETIAGNPDMTFGGPYRYPDDLAALYGQVDLAWLVDRYDAGANSDWLLPNRLYESGRSGVPPICLAGTQVALTARQMGIGIVITDASVDATRAALEPLDTAQLAALWAAQAAVPAAAWSTDAAECRDLVASIVERPGAAGLGRPYIRTPVEVAT